jgi:fructose-1-phosphate kinase PfkB-like protein
VDAKPANMLSHLHDKGTYAAGWGIVSLVIQELNIDSTLKVVVGLFTIAVLYFTIQEKRHKIKLTKLQIEGEIKEHHLPKEEDE